MNKGLTPLKGIKLVAFSEIANEPSTATDAISNSDRTFVLTITDCVIKSLTWAKGDGQVLQDKISSCDCRMMTMQVKNACSSFDMSKGNTKNQVVESKGFKVEETEGSEATTE